MKDFFEIESFDRFIACEFKNSPMFPAMIVAEEIALANAGADHTFLKNIFRDFFKMTVNTPADAVSAALKAVQLCAGGYDQALKAFTTFFLKLNEEERIRFYDAADTCAYSLDLRDPYDWITLEAFHDLNTFFPGEKSQERTVTMGRSYVVNNTPETFTIWLGELGETIFDRNMPTDMAFEDRVLYCVVNMWLHPTDRRDYAVVGCDPDDPSDWAGDDYKKSPEYAEQRSLKDAVTKRYNLELKAARQ